MKKSICIVVYSPVAQDARVLRQVRYLAPHYRLTVIGFGAPHPTWAQYPDLAFHPLTAPPAGHHKALHALNGLLGPLGLTRHLPGFLEALLRTHPAYAETIAHAIATPHDAILANDHDTLPPAVVAAETLGAKLVFDAHEHAPSLYDDDPLKRSRHVPLIHHILARYARRADAYLTVAAPIAERYRDEYGFTPMVVMNAPERVEIPDHQIDPARITLVHHGAPIRDRKLEWMIETMALAPAHFSLTFMLTRPGSRYVRQLKALADREAPGRVTFIPPVPPEQVVPRIAAFDLGLYLLNPSKFNNVIALPNKFFDYIAAGLPALIGPSPSMAALIAEHGCGWVMSSFSPAEVASALARLTPDEITAARDRTRLAAQQLNAEVEMAKLLHLFGRLLEVEAPVPAGM